MSNKKDPFYEREAQRYENPIPSREYILQVILEQGQACSRDFLIDYFKLRKQEEAKEALRRRLNAMLRDAQLCKTKAGYTALSLLKEVTGILSLQRDGFGRVAIRPEHGEPGEEDFVKILPRDVRGYYDGDVLCVRIVRYSPDGDPIGEIIELKKAQSVQVVGRLISQSEQHWIIPLERKYTQDIMIESEHLLGAQQGDIVVVNIIRPIPVVDKEPPIGQVVEILGDPQTPGIELKMAIRKFQIPEIFSQDVNKQANRFRSAISAASKKGRLDLSAMPFVTIDGEDARDFDDAVYCRAQANGGYTLRVAIADVSYYVKPGSALDTEAKRRGNSVYFPGLVIPMLPESLSNGLCSLKPQEERLVLVCELELDNTGQLIRSKFYRGVIFSAARLTYNEVAKIIEGETKLRKKYNQLLTQIDALHQVYQLLKVQRERRGAIDFETVETQLLFDTTGKIQTILPMQRNVAHRIIEECMLAANVVSARFLAHHKIPTLYRVHAAPSGEKLKAVREFLSELSLNLKGGQNPAPKDYADLMHSIQDREDKHIIETVLLRSLSQAEYSPDNHGHFGLAYSAYVHFTSPIRRYPDLLVHRQIISILEKSNEYTQDEALHNSLVQLGMDCSTTERRADEATRDAIMALKCHYMQDKIGEVFIGRITGVTAFGFFVELQSLYIDGLVHVATLGDDYYFYEPFKHRMIGEHTRQVFKLGDVLEVRLVKVDVDDKKIDLEIVRKQKAKKQNKKPTKKTVKQTAAVSSSKKKVVNKAKSMKKKNKKSDKKSDRKLEKQLEKQLGTKTSKKRVETKPSRAASKKTTVTAKTKTENKTKKVSKKETEKKVAKKADKKVDKKTVKKAVETTLKKTVQKPAKKTTKAPVKKAIQAKKSATAKSLAKPARSENPARLSKPAGKTVAKKTASESRSKTRVKK